MKPTEKLYYKENRSISFEAKISEQYKDKKGWVVILDRTLFYPEGGGQPADKGWLNNIAVNNVQKKDGLVLHYISEEIKAESINGKIDWIHRFDFMQQHTGQHLISGALWNVRGYKTVSVNMSVDYTSIEIEAKDISLEDLNKTEDIVNSLILENLPVSYVITKDSELSKFQMRKSCSLEGEIRLVRIGDFDCVACGGIHLGFTSEVRLVKLIKTEKIRGNVRIYWKIGDRAYLDYRKKTEIISKLKTIFNSNEENLEEKVNQLNEEIGDLKLRKSRLSKKLIGFYKENLLKKYETTSKYKIILEKWEDQEDQFLLNLIKAIIIEKNIIICFTIKTDKAYKWIIGCSEETKLDFNMIRENLLKPFDFKGGGKHPIWQGVGNTQIEPEDFLEIFERLVKK